MRRTIVRGAGFALLAVLLVACGDGTVTAETRARRPSETASRRVPPPPAPTSPTIPTVGADVPASAEVPEPCVGIGPSIAGSTSTRRADAVVASAPARQSDAVVVPRGSFPEAAGVQLEVLDDEDRVVPLRQERSHSASARVGASEVVLLTDGARTQVLGLTEQRGIVTLRVRHDVRCPGWERVKLTLNEHGVMVEVEHPRWGTHPIGQVSPPFAIDATGDDVPSWFEVHDDELWHVVDTSNAALPVLFDPDYGQVVCAGAWSVLNAVHYLNMTSNNLAYCPVMGMFQARNGYLPVTAFETNVANDYGLVVVRQAGDCSGPEPDVLALVYDFQVPCKAHDYCYDLRKAGFSETVADADCDSRFRELMMAHCDDRNLQADCEDFAEVFYLVVRLPGVVTDPDPGRVRFRNLNSILCANVANASTASGAPIVQYPCVGAPNETWRIMPVAGSGGYFRIVAEHSGKCLLTEFNPLEQWSCQTTYPVSQMLEVRGAFNLQRFTLRSAFSYLTQCVDVPGSSLNVVALIMWSCFETPNQLWLIQGVGA